MIYKEGKIVVLTIPIEYESIGFTLGKLIREIFTSPHLAIRQRIGFS